MDKRGKPAKKKAKIPAHEVVSAETSRLAKNSEKTLSGSTGKKAK